MNNINLYQMTGIFIVISFFIILPAQSSSMTAEEFLNHLNIAEKDDAVRVENINNLISYVRGAMDGIVAYHKEIEAENKLALFCPSAGGSVSLDVNKLRNIMREAVNQDEEISVTSALLHYLQKLQPCI
ncbi:MAG: hypothetical protein H6912_04860 [Kordiimonadaceae bacterium]|nr:hypothetical protein [Kordiimonadaceae bacterium]